MARVLRLRIPPEARLGGKVRRAVSSFAAQADVVPDDLQEFMFALGEALANAIEHAQSRDAIEVRCFVENEKILGAVVDSGTGLPAELTAGATLPDPLSERGRGLPIIRRCSDLFAIHSEPSKGTAVVVGRYLRKNADRKLAS